MEAALDALCYPVSNFWGEAISLGQADFTPCFENTAILLVPCLFLFLLAIVQFCAEGHKNKSVNAPPPTAIHVFRTLFAVCLGVIAFVDLMKTIFYDSQKEKIATYQYLSPSILFVTSSLALVCITWFRNRGSRAPGTLLIFWLLMLIYVSLKLRTYILVKMHGAMEPFRNSTGGKNVTYNLILTSVEFAVVLASFILSLIPEKLPYVTTDESLRPCPETKATFLSRITFWWLTNMMFLGYKRPLTDDDLFDLFPEDKADFVVPRFLDAWKKEICKTERKNAKLIQSLDPSSLNADETALNASTESLSSSQENLLPRPKSPQRPPVKLREPSLLKALVRAFGGLMFTAAFFKLVQDLLTFVSPQILKLMINFTANPTIPTWRGYVYAVLLFVNAETQSLFLNQYFHRCFRTGIRLKSAIISAVYRKAMRLNNSARRQSTVGEIVNLMSVDAQRFMDLMPYIHLMWSAPLQMVLAIFFLWQTIGVSVLAGVGVMVLLIPVNAVVAVITRKLQIKQMAYKDQRIKLTNEVLSGIKVIKLYAWEKSFLKSIACVRKKELTVLKWSAYLGAVTTLMWTCAPFMVALATFATYSLTGHNLTSSKAFVALSLFDILNFPLSFLPMLVASMVQAMVSVKRVQAFLKSDELDPDAVVRIPVGSVGEDVDVVKVEGASFRWSKGDRLILKDLNLNVKPKKLVAIVGQVGAGKSSFMSALLGDMEKDCGSIFMKGSIAYAPQQAWVQNASLRDNILFGRPYDGGRYNRALHACALTPDLEVLPAGDKTEIGEKGINLSGGQKQRVSLARAVYHDSDIYLMDDPLSAVDSHVGKHIFDNVIGPEGVLKDKIRIFVTHGVSFLPQCDQIVVMKEGNISEIGTYAELQANDGDFAEFLRNYAQSGFANDDDDDDDDDDKEDDEGALSENDVSESATGEKERKADLPYGVSRQLSRQLTRQMSRQISRQKKEKEAAAAAELTTAEKAETGNVRFGVYADYFRSCTWILVIITLVFFTLQSAASVASSIWLARWSDVENELATNSSARVRGVGYYLGVYAGLGFSQGLIVTLSTIAMTVGTILAAMKLHGDLLVNILRSPMSFFDTTPLGRIVNRFSKDIYMIDEVIPQSLGGFLHTFFISVGIVFIISYSTPVFLAVMVPLGVFYFFTQRFYVASSRQLKRIESVTRSPVHSHFQESLNGTSTIRAYGATETFVGESDARVDRNQTAYYPNVCSNRWLAVRLEFVGNCIILFAALFAVIERKSSLTPGLVGLSISYALQITQTMNWIVRMTSALEANIVSVERVKEYSESPTEAPSIVDHFRPRPGWPNRGEVEFKSYSTRYREGLDLVLKRINCHVMPGEKIGIVGRTGAGKSSLTVGIFRIIEAAGGAIVIDGIDISCLGLDDLRSRITIIPQDPVLFSGTLRFNLDPFENHTDDELWRSLDNAHLKDFVESTDAGLNYDISEGGENLSVGQRQLVCLARALLRKTKILVLDEATAAIDLETDDLIQQTIRREFDDCTVLTIAHRLNTVMDSNRIIVLDKGEKVEFDSPANLLANRGVFHGMAVDAGLAQ